MVCCFLRYDLGQDLARRNAELIEMGAEQAVINGVISIANYGKIKANIDLFSNCTKSLDSLVSELVGGVPLGEVVFCWHCWVVIRSDEHTVFMLLGLHLGFRSVVLL